LINPMMDYGLRSAIDVDVDEAERE
jgi:hypothetical protein